MGLEEKLHKAISNSLSNLSSMEKSIFKSLEKELEHYLKNERYRDLLEYEIKIASQKYEDVLKDWKKALGKPAGILALANDIYGYIRGIPFPYIIGTKFLLQGFKTLTEIPAIYHYLKESKDVYGVLKYMIMKPISYILPVVGPALDMGVFERMVKHRIAQEAKRNFLKKIGKYESLEEKIKPSLAPVPA
jgi:hypothetical protein